MPGMVWRRVTAMQLAPTNCRWSDRVGFDKKRYRVGATSRVARHWRWIYILGRGGVAAQWITEEQHSYGVDILSYLMLWGKYLPGARGCWSFKRQKIIFAFSIHYTNAGVLHVGANNLDAEVTLRKRRLQITVVLFAQVVGRGRAVGCVSCSAKDIQRKWGCIN